MTAHLFDHGVSYFSVPKCACTSLKMYFFEIENGFPFRPYKANGLRKHVHNAAYPSVAFTAFDPKRIAEHWKTAVVRDPVSRVLSCYSNRVVTHRELDDIPLTAKDRRAGIVANPDLQTFVRHIKRYCELSNSIRRHLEPLSFFLGTDPGYFDAIYPIGKVDALVEEVNRQTGAEGALGHYQASGRKLKRDQLTEAEISGLERHFAQDYELYGEFF